MANSGEVLINVVSYDKPKMLTGLGQKVSGQVRALLTHPTQMLRHRRKGTAYFKQAMFLAMRCCLNPSSRTSSRGPPFEKVNDPWDCQ